MEIVNKQTVKKLNLWEKNGCRQKCLNKSLLVTMILVLQKRIRLLQRGQNLVHNVYTKSLASQTQKCHKEQKVLKGMSTIMTGFNKPLATNGPQTKNDSDKTQDMRIPFDPF